MPEAGTYTFIIELYLLNKILGRIWLLSDSKVVDGFKHLKRVHQANTVGLAMKINFYTGGTCTEV